MIDEPTRRTGFDPERIETSAQPRFGAADGRHAEPEADMGR